MLRRTALIAAVGGTLAIAALAAAPAAEAHGGNVGFSFSIAGPGYAVGVGNPYYAPAYVAPTYVAPAPAPYYYGAPAYYAAPVYTAPVVVSAPYRYYGRPYSGHYGRVYYHGHHR